MKYGNELIKELQDEIVLLKESISNRFDRINMGWTDMDDCFLSQRCEERGITNAEQKIALIKNGGCMWFSEYATLDGKLVNAHWCKTKYGYKLRAVMPDGSVVWTSADTAKGLAKKGLKRVECLRPAWYKFSSGASGLLGVYSGTYVPYPSDINYATGEPASSEPIEMRDAA
jgi:hypothetical protein